MQKLPNEVTNKAILVVDDAASMRALLCAILKSFGFKRIYEASNGEEALKMLEARAFDLVFCDWEMPKKDGLELFKCLKKDENLVNIPFVLVTSMAEMDKVKTAITAGVVNYIVKPFKEDTLLTKIKELFASVA